MYIRNMSKTKLIWRNLFYFYQIRLIEYTKNTSYCRFLVDNNICILDVCLLFMDPSYKTYYMWSIQSDYYVRVYSMFW